eukprot:gene13438-15837_t
MTRTRPNILITGTPGTGKTSLAETLASTHDFKHVDVSALVKEKDLHDGYDEEFQCLILDEDKVCDELEDVMAPGDCEIMQLILEEAHGAYKKEIIVELQSNNIEDNEHNQKVIGDWITHFMSNK